MRVILDTDLSMGEHGSEIDDGIALALAVADPQIEVVAVTTVHGNTHVRTATRLTRDLLSRLGHAEIPVHEGAHRPLLWPSHLPQKADRPSVTQDGAHAAMAMVDYARRYPGELTVIAIGPLTNVGLAMRLDPEFAQLVERIVVMGGLFLGQTGRAAMPGEFNFWVDPHAARIVLGSGADLRLVGIDVTAKVQLTLDDVAEAREASRLGAFVAPFVESWIEHLRTEMPGLEPPVTSCAMHDPLAVSVVTQPDLVEWRPAAVEVAADSELTRGVAIADLLAGATAPSPNCQIAVAVDAERSRRHIVSVLAKS